MHDPLDSDGLFAVALLRLALELKQVPSPGLEEAIRAVSGRMRLDEPRFRAFLLEHVPMLEGAVPARASAPRRRTPRG